MEQNIGREVLDVKGVKEFFGGEFSEWTIYNLVRRKEIPHIRVGKRVLFRRQTLIKWLASKEAESIKPMVECDDGKIRRLK